MPNIGWISFGGTNSADMVNKLIVHKVPNLNRSAQKIDVFSVPARDGDIILQQGAWSNQIQEYDVYIGDGDAAAAASELASWLFNLQGYQELKDGWEQDVYRLAYLTNPWDIESIMGKVGHVTLSFSCVPKRFLESGRAITTLFQTGQIENPTAFTAQPLIRVTGTADGTGTITCGGNTLGITFPSSVTQMFLDCENLQAYSTDGLLFYNSYITGSFPVIPTGMQTFAITGDISSVEITPRWFRR